MNLNDILTKIKPHVLSWIDNRLQLGKITKGNVPKFYPLADPITSANWNLTAYSTTAKTLITVATEFSGVPLGVIALLLRVGVRDSGSASNDTYLILSPNDTAGDGIAVSPFTVNDREFRTGIVVPCNSDGDVYYQIQASGAKTFDALIQVYGWWR